jgi:hypothetical protein
MAELTEFFTAFVDAATSGPLGATWSDVASAAGQLGSASVPYLVAGGVGLGALGIYQQGQAAAAAAKGQQAVAEYNAKVAQQQATSIDRQTEYRTRMRAEQAAQQQSGLLAAAGASGVVPSEGSPLMVQAAQAAESELDTLMIGYQGQVAAAQQRSQAGLDTLQAGIYGQQAGYASTAGLIGAGTTLLQGFGNYSLRRQGF